MIQVHSELIIDLDKIANNYIKLLATTTNSKVACVIKANAYGLGAVPVYQHLQKRGCDTFFVSCLKEAVHLRELCGPDQWQNTKIAVLHGPQYKEAKDFSHYNLIPVLNSVPQFETWFEHNDGNTAPSIIHIDTGMNRLGIPIKEANTYKGKFKGLDAFPNTHIMSHLACADTADHALNREQLDIFNDFIKGKNFSSASLANSAGIFIGENYHLDLVRPGIALYGFNLGNTPKGFFELPIKLTAPIIQVRNLHKGETVGYGAHYEATRTTKIATIALGYADGFYRSTNNSNISHIYKPNISGYETPIVGNISMDLIGIDVTNVPEHLCKPGQSVTILSNQSDINEITKAAQTIPYEMLTRLSSRIKKTYIAN